MSDLAAPPGRGASILAFVGFLLGVVIAGALGGLVTVPAIPGWYAALVKPNWTPPDWLFGPVWSLLYLLMSIAAWMVWRRVGSMAGARAALRLFWVQLVLNAVWSFLFFGMRHTGWGLVDIALLIIALIATVLAFWRVRPTAGALLIPYLLWACYAASLNAAIWWING